MNVKSLYRESDNYFEVDGFWESRKDFYICRYCVITNLMNEENYGRLAGIVGGYSGGGTFQLERFYVETGKNCDAIPFEPSKLIIEAYYDGDWFNDMDRKIVDICDDAYELFFRWHEYTPWEDYEQIYLKNRILETSAVEKCKAPNEDCIQNTMSNGVLYPRWLCNAVGLTAAPRYD